VRLIRRELIQNQVNFEALAAWESEERTGELDESAVRALELLLADQDTTGPIELATEAFGDRATRQQHEAR
jgi:hypothetical protein